MVKGRQKLIQMLRPLLRLLLMLNQMLIQASPDAHPPIPPPDSVHKTPVQVKPPVCHYVPVKHCENVPTHSPRRVAQTVCAIHVDVTAIEDCNEVLTTNCHQTTQTVTHTSNIVGHDTRVGVHVQLL